MVLALMVSTLSALQDGRISEVHSQPTVGERVNRTDNADFCLCRIEGSS